MQASTMHNSSGLNVKDLANATVSGVRPNLIETLNCQKVKEYNN